MSDTKAEKKVSQRENNADPEPAGPRLLIEHKGFSYKTKDGRTVHVKPHVEVNPRLSASRKKQALRLKAELEATDSKPKEHAKEAVCEEAASSAAGETRA